MEDQLVSLVGGAFNYEPMEVVINSFVAFILSMVVANIYKQTHQGLSYSQSFVLTIIFVSIIIGFVMMVIGNSLARAFALVGALSIIRFRTVVKDTKDTAYVFMALAIGMAAGTGNYFIALYATMFMSSVAWLLYKFRFGIKKQSDFILRFFYDGSTENQYSEYFSKHSDGAVMLHLEPSGVGDDIYLTYDISLKEDSEMDEFISGLEKQNGIRDIVVVNSQSNVNY
jgi:hypothetical protein